MASKKYDVKKVSREILEAVSEQILESEANGAETVTFDLFDSRYSILNNGPVNKLLKAAHVSLRTKAQVDADIVHALRTYADQYKYKDELAFNSMYVAKPDNKVRDLTTQLRQLLAEETSD